MFECPDCDGKTSKYSAVVWVCQSCNKIHNIEKLLDLLRDLGVTEETISEIKSNIIFPRV